MERMATYRAGPYHKSSSLRESAAGGCGRTSWLRVTVCGSCWAGGRRRRWGWSRCVISGDGGLWFLAEAFEAGWSIS